MDATISLCRTAFRRLASACVKSAATPVSPASSPGTTLTRAAHDAAVGDIVAATLANGLMPLVVPQLKTITLGGAVTGLGIESSSFRHGLPHESVLEMDVLTADGEVVTVTPDGEHAELFAGFANSYGTLGYALRLKIELQPVAPYVRLEHRRVSTEDLAATITEVCGDVSAAGPD